MTPVSEIDVLRALAKLIHEQGPTLRAASIKLGYAPGHLSSMLRQREPIPKPLLNHLGFTCRKVRIYEVKDEVE